MILFGTIPPCMAISITQSSKVELEDWLGIIGTTRSRGTFFFQKKIQKIAQPHALKTFDKIRANPR
jgi:hypothetical protein